MKLPRWVWALAVVGVCVPAIFGVMHKSVDARWEACGVGDREVRDLASDGKRIFAAVNQPGHGDVMTSSDQCMTFNPSMLTTEVVWSVSWFPEHKLLCAGARDQLYCGEPTHLRATTVKQDIYYVVEHDLTLVAGGYPSVFIAPAETLAFEKLETLSYASAAAAETGQGVLLTSDRLWLVSVEGKTMTPANDEHARAGAIAAKQGRVYVAGSEFQVSNDSGHRFTTMTLPGTQPEVIVMPVDNLDVVLVGTHGDVRRGDAYLSRDRGKTWQALGCPGSEIHALLVDEKYVYCGATALTGTKGMWRIPREAVGL